MMDASIQSQKSGRRKSRVADHLQQLFGTSGRLLSEDIASGMPVDVRWVPSSAERPFELLVSEGMSARPMSLPEDHEQIETWRHAELCLFLPAGFKVEQEVWPLRLLRSLARLPHAHGTWIGRGHVIPNGEPPRPYARGLALCGAVIVPPGALADTLFEVPGEPPLHIFRVLPVTARELHLRVEQGMDALAAALQRAFPKPLTLLNPARASAVARS